MVKKHKFSTQGRPASGWKKTEKEKAAQASEELKNLEDLPLVGGLFKGLGKFIDLAERVEAAGGELRKQGEIKGLGEKTKGIYGFSIRTGIGERPKIQTFGNIKTVPPSLKLRRTSREKERVKPKFEVTATREPIVDVFDERDQVRIVAETPGVSEERVKLDLKGDILILEAGDEKRKYFKEILLPAKVNFEKKETNFKNGILEIKIPKKK